jgi:pyruvate dehydrogenase E1 component
MGEPESLAVLLLTGREQLDNLIVVVNCNLQRLHETVDGELQHVPGWRGRHDR